MSDMHDQDTPVGLSAASIDRRKLMGGIAVLAAASTVAAPALAAVTGPDVRTLRAAYALRGGKTINGFFAAPKGKGDLGVVLVVAANDGEAVEEIALRYARSGFLAIAPDFAKAQGDAGAGAARDTKVAEVMRAMPGLKKMMQGNGRVTVVAA
jgi:hypothetical protein